MTKRILLSLLAIGFAAGWWLVQRGSDSDSDGPAGYLGRTYVLQSPPCESPKLCGQGFRLAEGSHMELSLSRGLKGALNLWFIAGCNSHNAEVLITDTIRLVDGMMSTQVGCNLELHQQEAWLASFLAAAPTMMVNGPYLTLTGKDAKLVLLDKKIADPDRPLEGRLWTARHYLDQGSISWTLLETYPWLSFANGKLSIFDGCNQLEGQYTTKGNSLTLSDMKTLTQLECTDPQVVDITEHYKKVFVDSTFTYSINANKLRLERERDGVLATTD